MGLFNKNPNEAAYVGGKKHWADVIKNSGPGELLIWRQPEEDFNTNSTLIVMPGEEAIFIIGETAILGDNITLYQGVTLGGTGKEKGKRHPTLKDNVMVSAGAKVIGSFTIGENSKIGAGSVVLEEVPPNCTVVGVPGRIVRRDDKKVPREELDQVHLPDPVLNDIRELQIANFQLHEQLLAMEERLKKCVEQNCKN